MTAIPVTKTPVRFVADPKRVITKPFGPAGEISSDGRSRVERILARVAELEDCEVVDTLKTTTERFASRHPDLRATFDANFQSAVGHLRSGQGLSTSRRLLVGAYFTHEYSIEAAALSNPCLVVAPNQEGLEPGQTRLVLSLRAIGEGHVSSVEFRSGVIHQSGQIEMDPPGPYAYTAPHRAPLYDKNVFRTKLSELHAFNAIGVAVLEDLPDRFTMGELEARIEQVDAESGPDAALATRTLHWLASSNYESSFPRASQLSERVLFPTGPAESRGMEDARFVRFVNEDGAATYFGTYTAFDGHQILPQLIETTDFLDFRMATLNGKCARNKGIALFPRKVGGHYVALARLDNENNFLTRSDNVRFWHEGEILQTPKRPWELTQLGNCGSPLETEAGWLVLTHGVGAVRQYSLGAILLDLEDPARVIGHLKDPLLEPDASERDGYVPNVLYSCGSVIVDRRLVLPYGFSDVGTKIATIQLDDLLGELVASV